jgi:hypothetical protein
MDPFGAMDTAPRVEVDLITDAYRISGGVRTRFARVTDILNQLSGAHLTVEQATISEHADPSATLAAPTATVDVASILLFVAPGLTGAATSEMRIPKRAVKAMLVMPPLRITGTIHVPMGSRPLDGVLNVTDRFLAMTDVTITSGVFPELGRTVDAAAVCRARTQVFLVADDERPDELLADVLDERTAEAWLRVDDTSR